MDDQQRELDFYREQCKELGAKILHLQESQMRIKRESIRTKTTATLIREAYSLANIDVSVEQIGLRFLQVIIETLMVDRAAFLLYDPEKGRFESQHSLGFSGDDPTIIDFTDMPERFNYRSSESPETIQSKQLFDATNTPFFLWSFDDRTGIALLIGNSIEDQHLHSPFENTDREIVEGALNVFIEIVERNQAEDYLQYRFAFERLISDTSLAFINMPHDQIDEGIRNVLGTIAEFTDVHRASVFLLHRDRKNISNTHEWCRTPEFSFLGFFQNIPAQTFKFSNDLLRHGKSIAVGCLEDLPSQALEEHKFIEENGFRPFLLVPMLYEGSHYGVIGLFGEEGETRSWSPDFNMLLKFMSDIFVGAIERKRAESELRKSEMRLRHLVEHMPVLMEAQDSAGNIVAWNRECERVTGYLPEEIISNKKVFELLYPDCEYRDSMIGERHSRGNNYRNLEWDITCKDGSVRTIAWSNISEEISIPGWASWSVGVDITELKKAEDERLKLEAQVQQAQKLESLGVLAGGIAHDFNNLLMGILGNADLALDELPPGSSIRHNLHEIEIASKRAADLCRQMLAYSGRGRFIVELININEVVQEMAHLLQVSISKRATLKYNFAENVPAIEADVTQIRQIVMNLITNASEAIGDEDGVISISTGTMECKQVFLNDPYLDDFLTEGEYLFIEVEDTGCGMDEEIIKKIYEPFFTTKFTGRGLGMAAVLGIVRGHKGTIRLTSKKDEGTTFTVLFPALDRPAVSMGTDKVQDGRWRGKGTILLVDDEDTIRVVGKKMLMKAGFTVLTASDGYEAIEQFSKNLDEIVCVVLDMTMPHMDGEEAFVELRKIDKNIRVILSSGYNEQEIVERFEGSKISGFIQKPYRSAELIEKLQRVLEIQRDDMS